MSTETLSKELVLEHSNIQDLLKEDLSISISEITYFVKTESIMRLNMLMPFVNKNAYCVRNAYIRTKYCDRNAVNQTINMYCEHQIGKYFSS